MVKSQPSPRKGVASATARVADPLKTMSHTARQNWLDRWQTETSAGSKVTEETALSIDTVFTCVRVLAESMAALPFELLKEVGKGEAVTIEPAIDHPVYELIRWQPNPETTAYEFMFWLMCDCLIRGRGVAQVQRDGKGRPIALWQLEARRLCPKRAPDDKRLIYTYSTDASDFKKVDVMLEADEVLNVQMMPYGGLLGFSLIMSQREALGASKASEQYASEFFANGGAVSGVIEVPEELGEEAYLRLKKDWKENHSKKGKRHGVPILEGDAKFHPLSLNHEESQLLETRKFQRSTIAGLFRIPAHLINDLEKATFSNIEEQNLNFAGHTLRPWMTNWQQRCRMILLTDAEKKTHRFKHDDEDLLRGDFPSRAEAYGKLIQAGVINPNQARRKEGWNPYKGGDTYFVQGALRPTDEPYAPAAAAGTPSEPPTKKT